MEKMYDAAKAAREEIVMESSFQLDKDNYSGYVFNGLNLSDIFSFLIQEAGNRCYAYASDMFYELKRLHEDLAGETTVLLENPKYNRLIGVRELGVDSEFQLIYALDTVWESFVNRYKEIYEVEVRQEESELFEIRLYRVNIEVLELTYRKLTSEEQEEDSGNMPCDTYGMCSGTSCHNYFKCQGK